MSVALSTTPPKYCRGSKLNKLKLCIGKEETTTYGEITRVRFNLRAMHITQAE